MNRYTLLALPLALAACTPQDWLRVQDTQAQIATAVHEACGVVNVVAAVAAPYARYPQVADILVYVPDTCGKAEAVNAMVGKALNDPSTIAWVQRLADQIKEAVALVRR